MLRIEKKSIFTGKINSMDLPITVEQYNRWQDGELIQNVMPELSDDQREFLISGLMPGEFEIIFGEEPD